MIYIAIDNLFPVQISIRVVGVFGKLLINRLHH